MGTLTDLRAMIADRVESESGIALLEHRVCLDTPAAKRLDDLERRATNASDDARERGLMAPPEDPELDASIEAARVLVRAATVTVVFRALPGEDYQKVLIKHDGYLRDAQLMDDMIHDLTIRCYRYVVDAEGDKFTAEDMPVSQLTKVMNHGQWDAMTDAVLLLNRENVDIPF